MKNLILYILLIFSTVYFSYAQGSAGSSAPFQSRYIIDMPNAGVLPKGHFSAMGQAYSQGGILVDFTAGLFTGFNIGISFSGTNIIGEGPVTWQNLPGFHAKYMIKDEDDVWPAISLGANIQGRGRYHMSSKRFLTQSPGIYLAGSRNYKWQLGTVSAHAGLCYSFEPVPVDRVPNFYIGVEQSIGGSASLNLEFNATTDEKYNTYMQRKGLLNASVRWSPARGFTLEFQLRDLLEHINKTPGFRRAISLEYVAAF